MPTITIPHDLWRSLHDYCYDAGLDPAYVVGLLIRDFLAGRLRAEVEKPKED